MSRPSDHEEEVRGRARASYASLATARREGCGFLIFDRSRTFCNHNSVKWRTAVVLQPGWTPVDVSRHHRARDLHRWTSVDVGGRSWMVRRGLRIKRLGRSGASFTHAGAPPPRPRPFLWRVRRRGDSPLILSAGRAPEGLPQNPPAGQRPHGTQPGTATTAAVVRPGEPGVGHSLPDRRRGSAQLRTCDGSHVHCRLCDLHRRTYIDEHGRFHNPQVSPSCRGTDGCSQPCSRAGGRRRNRRSGQPDCTDEH